LAANFHVTLVHVTGARHAPWTQPASQLRAALETAFPGRLTFSAFEWSGQNSFKARFRAAQALAEALKEDAQEHPDCHHFIIGHSHGGNVALWALGQRNLLERISGVACLSTPFFRLQKRYYGSRAIKPFPALRLPVILVSLAAAALAGVCFEQWVGHRAANAAIWTVLIGCLFLYALLVVLAERQADVFISQGVYPAIQKERLCLIRHTGDEASAALSSASFFSWLFIQTIAITDRLWRKVLVMCTLRRWRRTVFRSFGIGFCCFVTAALTQRIEALNIVTALLVLLGMILCSFAAVLGTLPWKTIRALLRALRPLMRAIGLTLITPVLGLFALAFGPEIPTIALLLDVSAEVAPPGEWNLQIFASREHLHGLRHSAAYGDTAALAHIVSWMRSRSESVQQRFSPEEKVTGT
jgi:hypothetical protein